MTYTNETKRILEAIQSGDCCSDCNAPNGDRHFDECPQHPEAIMQREFGIRPMSNVESNLMTQVLDLRRQLAEARSYKSLPVGMVWQDYYSPDDVIKIRDELERRPLVPITDDLASERLDGVRDERDELLVRCDELKAELDAVRAERDTARAVGS